jgi:hypothetical protein
MHSSSIILFMDGNLTSFAQDSRAIKKCFDAYDLNQSGSLEKDEAMTYIADLLRFVDFSGGFLVHLSEFRSQFIFTLCGDQKLKISTCELCV